MTKNFLIIFGDEMLTSRAVVKIYPAKCFTLAKKIYEGKSLPWRVKLPKCSLVT